MREAEIIGRAGQPGTVTISTNMAGRGTDIKLRPGVTDVSGLYVIGPSAGRGALTGNCGDVAPGRMTQAITFYVSFEDDLMRNFAAADRLTKMMERFVEGRRKPRTSLAERKRRDSAETRRAAQLHDSQALLDYDDVMNKQREVIYGWRNGAIGTETPREMIYVVDGRSGKGDLLSPARR